MNELTEIKKDAEVVIPERWIQDGHDYILHLGVMKKAVVIAKYVPSLRELRSGEGSWYSISPRSIFPFGEAQTEVRFKTAIEAVQYAERIVLNWLNSIMIGSGNNKQLK